MIRKLIVNALYGTAGAVCRLADALSPTADEIWRSRAWKQRNAMRSVISSVTVHTTPDCVQCRDTKAVLDRNGPVYSEIDVTEDQAAADRLRD